MIDIKSPKFRKQAERLKKEDMPLLEKQLEEITGNKFKIKVSVFDWEVILLVDLDETYEIEVSSLNDRRNKKINLYCWTKKGIMGKFAIHSTRATLAEDIVLLKNCKNKRDLLYRGFVERSEMRF